MIEITLIYDDDPYSKNPWITAGFIIRKGLNLIHYAIYAPLKNSGTIVEERDIHLQQVIDRFTLEDK